MPTKKMRGFDTGNNSGLLAYTDPLGGGSSQGGAFGGGFGTFLQNNIPLIGGMLGAVSDMTMGTLNTAVSSPWRQNVPTTRRLFVVSWAQFRSRKILPSKGYLPWKQVYYMKNH